MKPYTRVLLLVTTVPSFAPAFAQEPIVAAADSEALFTACYERSRAARC